MGRWLKSIWVLAAVAVLVSCLLLYDGKPNSDAELLLGYGMMVLAFPLGMGITTVLGVLARVLFESTGYVFTTSYVSMLVTWLMLFAVGYLQWFVLVPCLWRRWTARRQRPAGA
ncbi:hypothetical protein OU995_06005 [Roseateles sp. SL47]|uniref:hypothetical protein n=1 Tax=Roseateles sp. SL47 TaxID=2995138 RepID=UPI00227137AC|nr:hypothetical protein [Roseateles sp. SL47]WAC74274.1 hypothetical protein OU995_06005 [Roseateles sp. SL47]